MLDFCEKIYDNEIKQPFYYFIEPIHKIKITLIENLSEFQSLTKIQVVFKYLALPLYGKMYLYYSLGDMHIISDKGFCLTLDNIEDFEKDFAFMKELAAEVKELINSIEEDRFDEYRKNRRNDQ